MTTSGEGFHCGLACAVGITIALLTVSVVWVAVAVLVVLKVKCLRKSSLMCPNHTGLCSDGRSMLGPWEDSDSGNVFDTCTSQLADVNVSLTSESSDYDFDLKF